LATETCYVCKGKSEEAKEAALMEEKRDIIEEISCLVKTMGTCLRKWSGADKSRRNVSSGSHRNGTLRVFWQVN